MRIACVGLLLLALSTAGCLPTWVGTTNDPVARSAAPRDTAPATPAARVPIVTPDEVDAGNAHEKANQLSQELEQEQKELKAPAKPK
jgi:hypothetical protein